MLLIPSKGRMLQLKGAGGWTGDLGGFSTDFSKLQILSKHFLPQCRAREFGQKEVS